MWKRFVGCEEIRETSVSVGLFLLTDLFTHRDFLFRRIPSRFYFVGYRTGVMIDRDSWGC